MCICRYFDLSYIRLSLVVFLCVDTCNDNVSSGPTSSSTSAMLQQLQRSHSTMLRRSWHTTWSYTKKF